MTELLIKLATPIAVAIGVIFSVIYNFTRQKDGVDDRLIANYEKLDKQQKEQLAEKDAQIVKYQTDMAEIKAATSALKENFAKEIGKLQGQIDAKDKELASLRTTALDPNLNLGTMLKEIHGFMAALTKTSADQTTILQRQEEKNK